jgi:hypothetical protein
MSPRRRGVVGPCAGQIRRSAGAFRRHPPTTRVGEPVKTRRSDPPVVDRQISPYVQARTGPPHVLDSLVCAHLRPVEVQPGERQYAVPSSSQARSRSKSPIPSIVTPPLHGLAGSVAVKTTQPRRLMATVTMTWKIPSWCRS